MLWWLFACAGPDGASVTADPGDVSVTAGHAGVDTALDSAPPGDSGTGGGGGGDSGSLPVDTGESCQPIDCATVSATCGSLDDGCGGTLDCGTCGLWNSCETNTCVAAACIPTESDSTDGGGRCGDLNEAWTARGINVGYYAYQVLADTPQYSGDYDGSPGVTFTPGSGHPGVILQVIPAGSYVGFSSTGPWYDPAGECLPSGECGDPDVAACTDSSPPLRPNVAGYYWGYGYSGASHMQGWIPADPANLVYAGWDSGHPCADGPAGLDYEIAEACGVASTCANSPSCGDVNDCEEGIDDCGSESCGAESGGALTPSAHRATVTEPVADEHTCTEVTPPDPSILCMDNGTDKDHYYVYPHGAYLYWAQDSTTKTWLHYGDTVQSYWHTRDGSGVLWDFVEVLSSGSPTFAPASDGAGAGGDCDSDHPENCTPCKNGGTCGWLQDVFLQ